jgi:hypothetical protein
MPTQIVRLHRRPDTRSPEERAAGPPDKTKTLQVLERSEAEIERAARIGGQVWDVTVELGAGPPRKIAGELLDLALGPLDPLSDNAGRVARARQSVVAVPLPALTKEQAQQPTSRKGNEHTRRRGAGKGA